MTTLSESVALPLPPQTAQERVLAYFRGLRAENGGVKLPLSVDLSGFGVPGNLALQRDVFAHVRECRDSENLNDEIAVSWTPGGDGTFPSFEGRLIVWGEDDPNASYVELRGSYEPPMGGLGQAFDAAFGSVIAHRTARQLLENVREGVLSR